VTDLRWAIVLTLAFALGDDLLVGNLAMPRMTMIFVVSVALGTAAAKLYVTWRNGPPR
jgi:hypothetical protein